MEGGWWANERCMECRFVNYSMSYMFVYTVQVHEHCGGTAETDSSDIHIVIVPDARATY